MSNTKTNKMLIDSTHPEETRVVVLRDGRIEEFDWESAARKLLRGNIYLAKVTRVEPSLQAAFVDYGGNRHGFLAFSEIHPDYYQIPMADRQALLAEEAEAEAAKAQAEAAEDALGDDVVEEGHEASSREGSGGRSRRSRQPIEARDARQSDSDGVDGPATHDRPADQSPTEGPATVGTGLEAFPQPFSDDQSVGEASAGSSASRPLVRHEPVVRDDWAPAAENDATVSERQVPTQDYYSGASGSGAGHPPHQHDHTSHDHAASVAGERHERPGFDRDTGDVGSGDGHRDHGRHRDGQSDHGSDGGREVGSRVVEVIEPEGGASEVETVGAEDAVEEIPDRPRRYTRQYKIQEVIRRRQIILVQVVKEERGNKGAALTTYLSLAGRYTVLMPNTARGGGISRKIANAADRKRLRKIVQELEVPKGMGLIVRTAGASRTKPEIKRDFEYLLRLWESVRDLTLRSSAPALVYEEGDLIKRSIRDLYSKEIDEIVVAGEPAFTNARDFMQMLMPSHVGNVVAFKAPEPLFTKYQIERQLNAMFSPFVTLRSGGYIVINQTEALVAVDINSGKSTREHNIEDTALKTNLEAADEIARQLKLRDLAGLIVIDFIDMEEKRNNRAVERRMKEALRHDRARIQVGRISHFGLLEMSRQRLRPGVLEGSTSQCPHCQGTGSIRSTESVALAVLRGIEDKMMAGERFNVVAQTTPEVALYILNQKRHFLNDMEGRYEVTISILASDKVHGANFVIERGPANEERQPARRTEVVQMDASHHGAAGYVEIEPEDDEPIIAEAELADAADADESEELAAAEQREGDGEDAERPGRRRRRRRRGGRNGVEAGETGAANAASDDDGGGEGGVEEIDTDQDVETIGGDGDGGSDDRPPRYSGRGDQRNDRRERRPVAGGARAADHDARLGVETGTPEVGNLAAANPEAGTETRTDTGQEAGDDTVGSDRNDDARRNRRRGRRGGRRGTGRERSEGDSPAGAQSAGAEAVQPFPLDDLPIARPDDWLHPQPTMADLAAAESTRLGHGSAARGQPDGQAGPSPAADEQPPYFTDRRPAVVEAPDAGAADRVGQPFWQVHAPAPEARVTEAPIPEVRSFPVFPQVMGNAAGVVVTQGGASGPVTTFGGSHPTDRHHTDGHGVHAAAMGTKPDEPRSRPPVQGFVTTYEPSVKPASEWRTGPVPAAPDSHASLSMEPSHVTPVIDDSPAVSPAALPSPAEPKVVETAAPPPPPEPPPPRKTGWWSRRTG